MTSVWKQKLLSTYLRHRILNSWMHNANCPVTQTPAHISGTAACKSKRNWMVQIIQQMCSLLKLLFYNVVLLCCFFHFQHLSTQTETFWVTPRPQPPLTCKLRLLVLVNTSVGGWHPGMTLCSSRASRDFSALKKSVLNALFPFTLSMTISSASSGQSLHFNFLCLMHKTPTGCPLSFAGKETSSQETRLG